jgi:[acyl-carrier-protein] S-malonyltransferase
MFPGQGAQVVGMGSELVKRSQLSRQLFDQAHQILGYDLLKLCNAGPADQLNRTEFSQPALFVHAYASLKQLELERPDVWNSVVAVAGLSLGEYTAVAAAGGFSFADGVKLVQLRGQAMQAAADCCESGMASVIGMDLPKLEEICQANSSVGSFVRVANLLCPGNIAISGHLQALQAAESACLSAGAMKVIRLQVAGAFHTNIMQSAVEKLQSALAAVPFEATAVPVYSNVDAAAHREPSEIKGLLAQQVVMPVQWEATLRGLLAAGVDRFIEIGSGRVLAGTLKRVDRRAACENIGD